MLSLKQKRIKMDLKLWLETNLGTNYLVSTILLITLTLLVIFVIWIITKKILHAFIPKLTAKTNNLWDDIIFNERIIKSLATLIPALILYQFLPIIFKDSIHCSGVTSIPFSTRSMKFYRKRISILTNPLEV